MFTGVTAGNAAFAESDDIDEILEEFCEMTIDEQSAIIADYALEEYAEDLAFICDIEDEDERVDALYDVIDEISFEIEVEDETEDEVEDYEDCVEADGTIGDNLNECTIDGVVFTNDEDDDDDDVVEDYEDCVEADGIVVDNECTYTDMVFVNDEDDDDDTDDDVSDKVLVCHNDKNTLSISSDALRAHLAHGDDEGPCEDYTRADFAEREFDDLLDDYCELTDLEQIQLLADHPRLAEFSDRLANYCSLSEDEQDAIDDLIEEHADRIRQELRAFTDEYSNKGPGNLRDRFAMHCDLTAEERAERINTMHADLPDDLREDLLGYCEMSEAEQDSFRDRLMDRMDVMRDSMKNKMHDKMTDHMEYDGFCKLTDAELAASTFDAEFVEKASKWCEMTPDEREDYMEDHREKKMKFSEKSDRLRAMIMDKRDISDERADEIRMKFEAKFGEDSDKKRSEIKMKYKDHMLKMKFKMSDERKSDVHERLAEMKAYKAELREKSSELSDEEKQQLREEFIEKAKDMQLAWISPRTQITAGVDPAEVECREGFSLVMKASNGVAMCLKADSALKMIDRGIVVPAN
jgi:hypothetical protein